MDENMNYMEMYLTMARAVEEAIRILIQAQQKCEEYYLDMPESEPVPLYIIANPKQRLKSARQHLRKINKDVKKGAE